MHELALAEDILRKIKEEAAKQGSTRVSSVKILLGASLVSDLPELKEILANISKGTVAEGMKLNIKLSPVKAACRKCGSEFDPKEMRLDCPKCGSTDIGLTSGKELIIEEMRK
jgi:hydrogenase nickel incorporation protein HypA/HybF